MLTTQDCPHTCTHAHTHAHTRTHTEPSPSAACAPPNPAVLPARRSGSYLKREGRPKDDDVLVARLVDRPLRPMFDKGWSNDTQVSV
jgi:hypothetical protein